MIAASFALAGADGTSAVETSASRASGVVAALEPRDTTEA
jgi:hypothetical protein